MHVMHAIAKSKIHINSKRIKHYSQIQSFSEEKILSHLRVLRKIDNLSNIVPLNALQIYTLGINGLSV